ncbi:MAG: DUF4935 domain-containing protein [Saprospiraceae bacterium]|nr:DUF4935 domain-containing protein [Saprospiraceae bacterium]
MKIVLDSNIIIADFWMQSPAFVILFESSKKDKIELFIPQVVVDEVLNKYNQSIESSRSDINSKLKKFKNLTRSTISFPIIENLIKEFNIKYRSHLDEIIKNHRISIIDYPNTNHEFLARKAMLSLKPFNINEKGYRDCLIWENIKSLVSPNDVKIPATPEVIFITNNHRDFTTDKDKDKDKLHDNLVFELTQRKFKP